MHATKTPKTKKGKLTLTVGLPAVARGPRKMPRAATFARKGTRRLNTRGARTTTAIREG